MGDGIMADKITFLLAIFTGRASYPQMEFSRIATLKAI